jgi:transcriptional regulator with XRE-family HTH domain
MTLGEKIKNYRNNSGWTQTELAEKVGVSTNLVSKWENNERNPGNEEIEKMSGLFGINREYFVPEKTSLVSLPVFSRMRNHKPEFMLDEWTGKILYEKVPADLFQNDIFGENPSSMTRKEIDAQYFLVREPDGQRHIVRQGFTRIVDKHFYALTDGNSILIRQLFNNPDGSFFSVYVDTSKIRELVSSPAVSQKGRRAEENDIIVRIKFPADGKDLIVGIVIATVRIISR